VQSKVKSRVQSKVQSKGYQLKCISMKSYDSENSDECVAEEAKSLASSNKAPKRKLKRAQKSRDSGKQCQVMAATKSASIFRRLDFDVMSEGGEQQPYEAVICAQHFSGYWGADKATLF